MKCHNTPGDNDFGSYEIKNLSYYGGGSPEEWLVWKDKFCKALDGQSISTGPLRYTFTEIFLTDDKKATFNQAALQIGICTVYNFNKVLAKITKHVFPAYAFCKQKRYLCRHLVKPRRMKLRSFISRLVELNANLEEFPPGAEGQETTPLPAEEMMDTKSDKELNTLIKQKIQKFVKNKKRRKTEKKLQHFQEMQISDSKKSVSSVTGSVESGEIPSSFSEWKIDSDELYVAYLNRSIKNELEKPLINYFNLFINNSLNHMSIESCLLNQPKHKLISNK